jgi:hypothetical protein
MTDSNKKLENGTEVQVLIPFTYTIGEEGFYSGKILETIEDCEQEVLAELKCGSLSDTAEVMFQSGIID